MATQAEYEALAATERQLVRERRGIQPRIDGAEQEIVRLLYEGRPENDAAVTAARNTRDTLIARRNAMPGELLTTRRSRLDALETLLPPTDVARRERIAAFREAQRLYGTDALNPARCDLNSAGLDVAA